MGSHPSTQVVVRDDHRTEAPPRALRDLAVMDQGAALRAALGGAACACGASAVRAAPA